MKQITEIFLEGESPTSSFFISHETARISFTSNLNTLRNRNFFLSPNCEQMSCSVVKNVNLCTDMKQDFIQKTFI